MHYESGRIFNLADIHKASRMSYRRAKGDRSATPSVAQQHGRPPLIPEAPQQSNRDHTVVRFRRRDARTGGSVEPRSASEKHQSNIVFLLSLAKYESGGRDDDYRRRMIANGLAFMVTVALIATGVWLASNLHD
jgi:hypothetical protein